MGKVAGLVLLLCCASACTKGSSGSTIGSATAAPVTPPSAAAPVASAAPLSDEAAEKVALDTEIAFMKAAVADKGRFPVKDATTYTADTDPNKLLGRPGQYVVKMSWKLQGDEATIEVFRSAEDAQKRVDYTERIAKSSPLFLQYIYINAKRSAVLRLPKELTPAQAKNWQTMFEAL